MGLTKKEVDGLTVTQYLEYQTVLNSVLKLWHAPYLKHDEEEGTEDEPEN